MKLNLAQLRKMGWHISFDSDPPEEIELCPPPMNSVDYQKLRDVIGANLQGDAIAMDLVIQQTLIAMQKAAFIAVLAE